MELIETILIFFNIGLIKILVRGDEREIWSKVITIVASDF